MHQSLPKAAQRAAAHCEALLKKRAAPQELSHDADRFGERVAAALRPVLGARQVSSLGSRSVAAGELIEHCGAVAANSVHLFGGRPLLVSLEARALLAQLERAFGGLGLTQGALPAELPLSADLLAQRMEAQIVDALSAELGGLPLGAGARGSNVAALSPFELHVGVTLMEFEVAPATGDAWRVLLAAETEALAAVLPRRAASGKAAPRKAGPNSAPFADLPLTASATLVDMAMPLHRLVALAPGDVLPSMVARSVPLQIGETLIARGTVGEVDKQVALQITQTFSGKDSQ